MLEGCQTKRCGRREQWNENVRKLNHATAISRNTVHVAALDAPGGKTSGQLFQHAQTARGGKKVRETARDTWSTCCPLVDNDERHNSMFLILLMFCCDLRARMCVRLRSVSTMTFSSHSLPVITTAVVFLTPIPIFFSHYFPFIFSLLCCFSLQMFDLNPDDIDLENEPWFKFFSELEFGRPVS